MTEKDIHKAVESAEVVILTPETRHLTELGNAERFVSRHGQDLRYCHVWGKWLVWDGQRWQVDATAEVMRRAKETVRAMYGEANQEDNAKRRSEIAGWALKCECEARIKSMVSLARAEPDIPVLPDELDTDRWLFNVLNGTIDLKTGELRPHHREDLITKLAPVQYNPDATCPRWLAFLDQIMNGREDLIRFLQRAVGYSLTGDTSEQAMYILHGLGANGKTTLVTVVRTTLGDYAKTTRTETLLIRREDSIPNDIARLQGARMVTAVEAEAGRRLAESLVKQLTGGDPVTARFLHAEWFEFVPTFKLWLTTNHRPRIVGTDDAIWRRIRLIPFSVTIPEKKRDPHLAEALCEESSGILAWAVRGCLEWQREGLGLPDEVKAATAAYRDDMDVLGGFLDECCVLSAAAETPSRDLRAAYVKWCEANGENPLSQRVFAGVLKERGLESRKSHGAKVWEGIQFRSGDDPGDHGEGADHYSPFSEPSSSREKNTQKRSGRSPSSPEDEFEVGEI